MKKAKYKSKKTVIYFNNLQSRETAIDFLLKLNIPFTYFKAFPILFVSPKNYIKHCLDLYLENIVGSHSRFEFKQPIN